jgi:hypothetical protein
MTMVEVRTLRVHEHLHPPVVESGASGGNIWGGGVLADGVKQVVVLRI